MRKRDIARADRAPESAIPSACPICGRELLEGPSIDRHHWVPKAFGGRNWGWMHQICHRKIHALFSERELAHQYSDATTLRGHPEMMKFIAWVKRRPPDFNDWHKRPRRRR